jgi:hypothetical protein
VVELIVETLRACIRRRNSCRMSSIFWKDWGQDSGLRHAPEAVLERALSEAHMIPELRAAILEGNQRMLETLLGVGSNVCCLIAVPPGRGP